MTRIASPRPAYCASCFNAVEERYVDFEAAYDGPVIPGTPEPIPVDDLVICEPCLLEAFNILDPQSKNQTIEELTAIIAAQQAQLDAKDKAILGFRASTNELIDNPVAPLPGRPKLEGLPDDVRELINTRRYGKKKVTA